MIRAVLDTNVLVSGLLSSGGICNQIIRKWITGEFILCICTEALEELEKVVRYPNIAKRHKLSEDEIKQYIEYAEEFAFKVNVTEIENVVKTDPSDNIFPACALAGDADYIVSGNYHLLDLKSYQSIKIITPRDFYDILITRR